MSRNTAIAPIALPHEILQQLVSSLEPIPLGVALKLIEAQLAAGEGLMDVDDICVQIGVERRTWKRARPKIERIFDLSLGRWSYPAVAKEIARQEDIRSRRNQSIAEAKAKQSCQRGEVARASAVPKQKTFDFSSNPTPTTKQATTPSAEPDPSAATHPRAEQVNSAEKVTSNKSHSEQNGGVVVSFPEKKPSKKQTSIFDHTGVPKQPPGALPELPDSITIDEAREQKLWKLTLDAGVRILINSGMPNDKARGCICQLLKTHKRVFVAEVIERTAAIHGTLAHPYSYMRWLLNENYPSKDDDPKLTTYSTDPKRPNAKPVARHRPKATPEFFDMSPGLVRRIKEGSNSDGGFDFIEVN